MLFIESSAKTDTSKVPLVLSQIFTELAHEVLRKIAKGDINPQNQSLGVKIGIFNPKTANDAPKTSKWGC
jgi:hypothetical protein